jgi:hypothetical protein
LDILLSPWTLMATTGTMQVLDRKGNDWDIGPEQAKIADGTSQLQNLTIPAIGMLATFLLAVIAMIFTSWGL